MSVCIFTYLKIVIRDSSKIISWFHRIFFTAPHFDEFFEQKLNSKWSNLINYWRVVFAWIATEIQNCCHVSIRIVWNRVWKALSIMSKDKSNVQNVEQSTGFHSTEFKDFQQITLWQNSLNFMQRSQVRKQFTILFCSIKELP